jgi:flagellar basal-body rod protein FlgF
MDVGLYIAAQGMLAQQVRQDQLSNDLANAGTPGYKPDESSQRSFNDLLLSNTSTGQPIGVIGSGVAIAKTVTDLTPAGFNQTGEPLDFAIAGTGFFAVRTAQGVRYTRDGQFTTNAQGLLTDAQGNTVLGQGGATIKVPAKGTLAASALGVFNLTGPAKQGDNLFTGRSTGRASGTVRQGELEDSGVDPVQTMVQMMAAMRTYEAGQKAVQSIDQTMQETSQHVGSLSG